MTADNFDKNIFINCPFDAEFAPLLEGVIFVCLSLGFNPRLATERADAGETRLDKIVELIAASRWSIHDLSRCEARQAGEIFRLNMPFELGIDYGCRQFQGGKWAGKRFLILEEQRYRFQKALSDISGSDISHHDGKVAPAMKEVRDWLCNVTGVRAAGPARLTAAHTAWQEWHWKTMTSRGYSEDNIRRYPIFELLDSIKEWLSVTNTRHFA